MSGEFTAFFYGTLMAPEVFYSVCYGDSNPHQVIKDLHTFTPATLDGYCRHRVQYADYPGIIAEKGHSVLGIYATGLTDANVQKLDYFEGSEYNRETVKVKLLKKEGDATKGDEYKETIVYVFNVPEYLEKKEWDFEEFRREKMKSWTRGDWIYEQDPEDKAIVNATA
ncbi:AIG2-like family-domain-containing protein [Thelonectria olida]|uniref:Putative gamma-glutamylcyclotransferase n=1 Tax=Thelonectria olida TaxID=1576542 RepID=A0A9P8W800_9HYPO|nr:AIG2-like family-domain-containing protein [Thelonectria olida]